MKVFDNILFYALVSARAGILELFEYSNDLNNNNLYIFIIIILI